MHSIQATCVFLILSSAAFVNAAEIVGVDPDWCYSGSLVSIRLSGSLEDGWNYNTAHLGTTTVTIDGAASSSKLDITCPAVANDIGPVSLVASNGSSEITISSSIQFISLLPVLAEATPAVGSFAGGQRVTIKGYDMYRNNASDAVTVKLAGLVANVISQSANDAGSHRAQIIIVESGVPDKDHQPGTIASTEVISSFGSVFGGPKAAYSVVPVGVVLQVTPDNGPLAGGQIVTINGTDMAVADSSFPTGYDAVVSFENVVAEIVSATPSEIVVISPAYPAGAGQTAVTVMVQSWRNGPASKPKAYTWNNPMEIKSVTPTSGRLSGGFSITVQAEGLRDDITSAKLHDRNCAIVSVDIITHVIVLTVPSSDTSGAALLTLTSASRGVAVLEDAFMYNAPGVVTALVPPSGPLSGTTPLLITGSGLGSSTDITAVTICGHSCTILSQTADSVTVQPGAVDSEQNCSVTVSSVSRDVESNLQYMYTIGNHPPVVHTVIGTKLLLTGVAWSFAVPSDTFVDPDGDALTVTAFENDGPLPVWLRFNAQTRQFSGTPLVVAEHHIRLLAQDLYNATATTAFRIRVQEGDTGVSGTLMFVFLAIGAAAIVVGVVFVRRYMAKRGAARGGRQYQYATVTTDDQL